MRTHISKIKKYLKKVVSYILYYTGITNYIFKKRLSSKIVVLTYHRVLPYSKRRESFSHQAIMVDPENFNMHLKVIKEYFTVIDEQTLMQESKNNFHAGKPQCLITFDDGWRDNYEYAYPLLKDNSCKAVIFVPLDYISSDETFWQEKLGYLIWKVTESKNRDSADLMKKHGLNSLSQDEGTKQSEIMNYVRSLKSRTYDEIDEILIEFSNLIERNEGSVVDKHMTWSQLLELSENGIKIGSHACSHKVLTRLTSDQISDEIMRSKSELEKYLKTEINSIAYPNGDYNKKIGEFTKGNGYLCGFGTSYGYVDNTSDIYNLKRININDTVADSKPLFIATLLGIF